MSIQSFGFSKMLSVQQAASAAHHCSPFSFIKLRVARGLLFIEAAIQGNSIEDRCPG
jgi:hypothetical protein